MPPHQHPVIVLRDTHGKVNVSYLLNLAENLQVKGLAQEHKPKESSRRHEVSNAVSYSSKYDGGHVKMIPKSVATYS